jgi:hypothetical protein
MDTFLVGGYIAGGYKPLGTPSGSEEQSLLELPNRYPKRMKSKSCSTDLMKKLPPNLRLKRADLMKRLMKRKDLLVLLVEQFI